MIVVGATNRLDIIDQALLRPGRFDRLIFVPLPDKATRKDIFNINLKRMQCSSDALELGEILAELAEGLSGAEIALVCREAGLKALSEDMKIETTDSHDIKVGKIHLESALQEVRQRGKQSASKSSLFN